MKVGACSQNHSMFEVERTSRGRLDQTHCPGAGVVPPHVQDFSLLVELHEFSQTSCLIHKYVYVQARVCMCDCIKVKYFLGSNFQEIDELIFT